MKTKFNNAIKFGQILHRGMGKPGRSWLSLSFEEKLGWIRTAHAFSSHGYVAETLQISS